MKKHISNIAVCAVVALLVLVPLFFGATPAGRAAWNSWFFQVQKVDDATNYTTVKTVEDGCRAMMASYTSDRLIYEQYVGSESAEKQSWAEQARMRANKTAATYNEYILKNSFVWEGNVPDDIETELPYI